MDIEIRPAELSDVQAILNIVNYEIKHTTSVYDYEERTLDDQVRWLNKKRKDGMPVIVAEYNNDVAGYGTFGIFRPWDAYQFSVEHSIYVAKKVRGKGIGRAIMKELISMATERGYHTMIAGIDASNKSSHEFHSKFGFVEVGRLKEVAYKFDKWLDLKFMQLFLK